MRSSISVVSSARLSSNYTRGTRTRRSTRKRLWVRNKSYLDLSRRSMRTASQSLSSTTRRSGGCCSTSMHTSATRCKLVLSLESTCIFETASLSSSLWSRCSRRSSTLARTWWTTSRNCQRTIRVKISSWQPCPCLGRSRVGRKIGFCLKRSD